MIAAVLFGLFAVAVLGWVLVRAADLEDGSVEEPWLNWDGQEPEEAAEGMGTTGTCQ